MEKTGDDYRRMYEQYVSEREGDEYEFIHRQRFLETIALAGPLLEGSVEVLELGGQSVIGVFARDSFSVLYGSYEQDLRLPFDKPSQAVDCVLCLEVLEHIKDSPLIDVDIPMIAHFNYSGIRNVFREARRVLKPGGIMIVTTPNAVSVDVLLNIVRGDHPHHFAPHVREMAPGELIALARMEGLALETFCTFFAWGLADADFRQRGLQFIEAEGGDPSDRGDDAFFVFRRPNSEPETAG